MKRRLVACVMAGCMAWPSFAGELRKDAVAATARWVLHFDVEQFSRSQMGTLLAEQGKAAEDDAGLAFVRNELGIDPMKDLTGVTLYGDGGEGQEAVTVIRGKLNAAKLEALARSAAGHEAQNYRNLVLHKWDGESQGKATVACFPEPGVAVLGPSFGKVRAALDVLAGRSASLKTGGALRGLDAAGAFLVVSAQKVNESLGAKMKAFVLKHAEWMTLSIGEKGGTVSGALSIGADSPDNALQMELVMKGVLAVGAFAQDQNPNLAEIIKALSVSTDNGVITVKLTSPARTVVDFLKAQTERARGDPDWHGLAE